MLGRVQFIIFNFKILIRQNLIYEDFAFFGFFNYKHAIYCIGNLLSFFCLLIMISKLLISECIYP